MKKLIFLVFLVCNFGFSQNLEDAIYSATEAFISNQNPTSYSKLKTQTDTFRNQLKTKDEQLAFVFLLCNKAYYLRYKLPNQAITDYEEAWNRYTKHQLAALSDFDIIENCLKPLGNLYIKNGDYTNAENIIKHYIFLAEQNQDKALQVAGAINLAVLYQTIGKHESAVTVATNALQNTNIATEQKEKLIRIKNFNLIASEKPGTKTINENDTVFPETYSSTEIAYQLALKNKDYKKALNLFYHKKLLLKKDSIPPRTNAKLNVEEAQLQFNLNDFKAASNALKNALKILLPNFDGKGLPNKHKLYAENTFIDIFDLLARLQPNTNQALACYNLSAYVSNLMYQNLTSQESKISNLAENRLRTERCIDLLYVDYQASKNPTLFTQALVYAESSKAKILKEVNNRLSLLEQFPNDSLLLQQQELFQKQERVTNLLINEQLGNANASKINTLSKELNQISIDLKQLNTEVSKKYPDTSKIDFDVKTIQQTLKKDDAAIVEYFYGKQALYQFMVDASTFSFKKIELNEAAKQTIISFNNLFENASIINNDIPNYTQQAFSLYQLMDLDSITSKNLIIIPDGLLNFTPFEALLTKQTVTANFSNMPFLLNKHNVLYNSNMAFYQKKKQPPKTPNVLGVFPVFDGSNQKLTYSIDEANYIDDEVDATLLLNENATKANFTDNASKFNTLHLSTHAKAGSFNSPASIRFFDDSMTLNELYSLHLKTDLVVLSACETGVGKVYKSEGAMSLARGFQYAGANNVLFTLWPINDLSTSQLMQSFYQSYSDHESAYLANHQSKIDYLNNTKISNSKKSPYYWSAFVYYGDLTHPQEKTHVLFYLLGMLCFGIVVFLIFKRKHHG